MPTSNETKQQPPLESAQHLFLRPGTQNRWMAQAVCPRKHARGRFVFVIPGARKQSLTRFANQLVHDMLN